MLRLCVGALLLMTACSSPNAHHRAPTADQSFWTVRQGHTTKLSTRGPSPNRFDNEALDARFERVEYTSQGRRLKGWLHRPRGAGPYPGLLVLHGSFAASAAQFEPLGDAFPPADFVTFIPAWRGENGNPGDFELLYGELDDAAAAVRWLSGLDDVDRVFAIGHSAGGGLAALLTLVPDLPLAESASVGGIYVPETFVRWSSSKSNAHLIRFDPEDPIEGRLRTLGPNVADMLRPHHAFIGNDDPWFHPNARSVARAAEQHGKSIELTWVEGDHMSSFPIAFGQYIDDLRTRSAP